MRAALLSTGSFLPSRIVPNEALTQFPAASLPLIKEKTGVESRRHAEADQCTSDLAIAAAKACLAKIQFDPTELDGIILATSSPDRIQPATATRVQHELGASRAFAFDVNSVCSGAIYALEIARNFIEAGTCRRMLVIGAEVYSRFLNPNDFSTYPYFGDGAGAVLLGADDGAGILKSILKTDGGGADVIQIPAGGSMLPFGKVQRPNDVYFRMNGKAVYEFALSRGVEVVRELLAAAEMNLDAVRMIISHQANINIIRALAAGLSVDSARFFVNLDRYGNTAAASIPIALDEAIASGAVGAGDNVVLVGFGGGLSWGATLLRL